MPSNLYINVHGEKFYLTLEEGELRFVNGSEQCQDCGKDLAECTWRPAKVRILVCDCGTQYEVQINDPPLCLFGQEGDCNRPIYREGRCRTHYTE